MDWNASTLWWLTAGVLVAAELATGTFYLLMLALGCVAGALAAHAGVTLSTQLVSAAVLGGGATVAWHFKRLRQPPAAPVESNHDVSLDLGQQVQVADWAGDGTARVHYRGAAWSVRLAEGAQAAPGPHVIVAVHGSELRVTPLSSH